MSKLYFREILKCNKLLNLFLEKCILEIQIPGTLHKSIYFYTFMFYYVLEHIRAFNYVLTSIKF